MLNAQKGDLVHSHGLWRMPNIYAGKIATEVGRPLVVSAHGMLAPEALLQSPWIKRQFWAWIQGPAYSRAAAWHATSEMEAEDIRRFGIKAPIAIIPYGVDLPASQAVHLTMKSCRTLLFLSRIHPHKGVTNLIQAWSSVAKQRSDWQLIIAGEGERSYKAELELLVQSMKAPRVRFVGKVSGSQKDQLYENADLFVLPSKSENFGLVVAEALAAGVPAVVTKGAPWRDMFQHKCGWLTATDPDGLATTLMDATGRSAQERSAMGARGRQWMSREFAWPSVAERMVALYGWILGRNERPNYVA
jgi:glycosyltransferase involved in cell wall biosynthesis